MDDREWMSLSLADFIESENNYISSFCGFVLLETSADFSEARIPMQKQSNGFVDVAYIPEPIPAGEFFPEDREACSHLIGNHGAQIMISVLPDGENALDAGMTYLQLVCDLLALPEATGVYSAGKLYTKEEFLANMKNPLPVGNFVAFRQAEKGDRHYYFTMGLEAFGVDELEYRVNGAQAEQNPEVSRQAMELLQAGTEQILREQLHLQGGDTWTVQGKSYRLQRIHSGFFDGHALLMEAEV